MLDTPPHDWISGATRMLGKNQKVATPLNGARAAIATVQYSGKTENKRWFQARSVKPTVAPYVGYDAVWPFPSYAHLYKLSEGQDHPEGTLSDLQPLILLTLRHAFNHKLLIIEHLITVYIHVHSIFFCTPNTLSFL